MNDHATWNTFDCITSWISVHKWGASYFILLVSQERLIQSLGRYIRAFDDVWRTSAIATWFVIT